MNATYKNGCTALIHSSVFGYEEYLDVLAAAGADVNKSEKRKFSLWI